MNNKPPNNTDSVSIPMLSTDSRTEDASTHPVLAVKQSNLEFSLVNPTNLIPTGGLVTRKEWIIPPRPKPGRKPATDTPPTKRKAQNRAAQRAFRERRAARVCELAEQLEEVREEQQKREADLIKNIKNLEDDVERFKTELNSWKLRCEALNKIADYEKRAKEEALSQLACLNNKAQMSSTSTVSLQTHSEEMVSQLQHQQQHGDQFYRKSVTTLTDPNPDTCTRRSELAFTNDASIIASSGCGNCTLGSSCECIEELIKETLKPELKTESKRSHSLEATNLSEKRTRQSEPSTPLETDFTTLFSKKMNDQSSESIEIIPATESCGFCDEGTYCLCAEAVANVAVSSSNDQYNNRLTPNPSENFPSLETITCESNQIFHESIMSQNIVNYAGPGTCRQCQADPRSGKFCRALSELQGLGTKGPSDCCGKNSGGDCCTSTKASGENPLRLTCAEAYKTLSSHRNYDMANDELSTWLGRLNAVPPVHPSRGPMEVEAASIMGVLKFFDRRFGKV